MTNTTDKGVKLMKPTFFKDNDPNNPKRKTYIEREATKKMFEDDYNFDASTAIDRIPAADVVSSAVLEQIRWERDMALETLEEHGIGFCEKSDVVEVIRCKKCRHYNMSCCGNGLGWCEFYNTGATDEHYCSHGERKGD